MYCITLRMEVFVEKDPKTIIMTMSMTHYDNEENQTSHQQGGLINVAACVKSATKRVEKMIAKKILNQAWTDSNIDDTINKGSDDASKHKREEDISYSIFVSKITHKISTDQTPNTRNPN